MTGKLYAIADLHLAFGKNREALQDLDPHPGDGLILVGDIGETAEHLELAFETAKNTFSEVFWCPGNHELYTTHRSTRRGEAKYGECIETARRFGVRTPEDDFFRWEGQGGPAIIAPIFTLYDYSFKPDDVNQDEALRWAEAADTVASDEYLLHPDPHDSRVAWCKDRLRKTEPRLREAADTGLPLIIANHWPLRKDLVHIPRVPRFIIWCGTSETNDWHIKFKAKVVVSGHLHVPRTDWKSGVRFEECSLGYPRQWEEVQRTGVGINELLREILPGPSAPESGEAATRWRRWG